MIILKILIILESLKLFEKYRAIFKYIIGTQSGNSQCTYL